ncbi:NADH dehydrogenase ubiquinone complex I [Perilla frutescens var. frutescens]|nr:NADH dehydrogenase ubiquinone complex I [Perilla frutescens var. frutescens]
MLFFSILSTSIQSFRRTIGGHPSHRHLHRFARISSILSSTCRLSFDSELLKTLKNFRDELITVVEFMEEVLMNPKVWFNINRDIFGAEGDC